MSRHSSLERIITINNNSEGLEGIEEEQYTSVASTLKIHDISNKTSENEEIETNKTCVCKPDSKELAAKTDPKEIEKLLLEREGQLKQEFAQSMQKQISDLQENFEFILQSEQIRTSYMLREARRERQEKISALQAQLECKNLAGLMYIMCSERRKSKVEKLKVIDEYTNYIRELQQILTDGQDLILHLSRGYKTAAQVDNEWREKMKKVIKEFQAYIYYFNGGTPETNQYLFDVPKLLTTDFPVKDKPLEEDPCNEEEKVEYEKSPSIEVVVFLRVREVTRQLKRCCVGSGGDDAQAVLFVLHAFIGYGNHFPSGKSEQPWWEQLDGDSKPFIMFGDMAEFQPSRRKAVLEVVKAPKSVPKKWKKYVFNDMFLHSSCENIDVIKDEYLKRFKGLAQWERQAVQSLDQQSPRTASYENNRRHTSIDTRGNMGSILKIVSSHAPKPSPSNRATLLAAKDSMEIASTTRLRQKKRQSVQSKAIMEEEKAKTSTTNHLSSVEKENVNSWMNETIEEEEDESKSVLGSVHNNSLQIMTTRKPDRDHKIHHEKVCPMEKCQRMQVDSFIRSLPPYMRDSPYIHFEQSYEDYESCSPEQLEMLRKRIAEKSKLEKVEIDECPLAEWTPSIEGIACQTSELDLEVPPCTCRVPAPIPEDSEEGNVYRVEDLFPIKQTLDKIKKECFYDDNIEFDRFKVIGQESSQELSKDKDEFERIRSQEIRKILKKHPSLCDIFLSN